MPPQGGDTPATPRKRFYVLEPLGVWVKRGRLDSNTSVGPTPLEDDSSPSPPAPTDAPLNIAAPAATSATAATASYAPTTAAAAAAQPNTTETGALAATAHFPSRQHSFSVYSPAAPAMTAPIEPPLSPVLGACTFLPTAACAPPPPAYPPNPEYTETVAVCPCNAASAAAPTTIGTAAAGHGSLEAATSSNVPASVQQELLPYAAMEAVLRAADAVPPINPATAYRHPSLAPHRPPPHPSAFAADAACHGSSCSCSFKAAISLPAGWRPCTAPAAFAMGRTESIAPELLEVEAATAATTAATTAAASCLTAVRQLSLPTDGGQSSSLPASAAAASVTSSGGSPTATSYHPPAPLHSPTWPSRPMPMQGAAPMVMTKPGPMPGPAPRPVPMQWAGPMARPPVMPPMGVMVPGLMPGPYPRPAPMARPVQRPAPPLVLGKMPGPMQGSIQGGPMPGLVPSGPAMPGLMSAPPRSWSPLAAGPALESFPAPFVASQPQWQPQQPALQRTSVTQACGQGSDMRDSSVRGRPSCGSVACPTELCTADGPRVTDCEASSNECAKVRDNVDGGDDDGLLPSLAALTGMEVLPPLQLRARAPEAVLLNE